MGKIISIINQKGGSGKTTTTTNMAACLTKLGHKVLVVDLDSQCNSTFNLGCTEYKERPVSITTLLNSILNKQPIPKKEEYIFRTPEGIDLIPSSSKEEFVLLADLASQKAAGKYLLRKFLRKEKLQDEYEFILLDNSPSIGSIYQNSILASTNILIPLRASAFHFQGMFELINSVQEMVDDEDLKIDEIILDGVLILDDEERTQVSKEIKKQLNDSFQNIHFYKTTIPHSQDIEKTQLLGKVLCNLDIKSKAKDAYFDFVKEYLYESENE